MSAPLALVATYKRIREQLVSNYPDLAEDHETIADTMDGLHGAEDIIASLIKHSREDEAAADALKALEAEYAARRIRLSARADGQKKAALEIMQELGLPKVTRPEFTASVVAGRPKVIINDPDALPHTLCREIPVRWEPDKGKIASALGDHIDVPGATLSNAEPYLTVRIK